MNKHYNENDQHENDDNSFASFHPDNLPNAEEGKQDQHMNAASEKDLENFDEALPSFSGGISRGVNKKGIFFLGTVALVLVGGLVIGFQSVFSGSTAEQAKAAADDEVVIATPQNTEEEHYQYTQPEESAEAVRLAQITNPSPNLGLDSDPFAGLNATNPLSLGARMGALAPEKVLSLADRRVGADSGSVLLGDDASGNGGAMHVNGAAAPALTPGAQAMQQQQAIMQQMLGGMPGAVPPAAATASRANGGGDIRRMNNRDTVLLQGTYIRCVLETRVISVVAGPAACVVTDSIYSASGKRLLLERGSRVFGEYGGSGEGEYDRVAIIWNRVVTPSGRDVRLDSQGMDNLGGVGHPGRYNSHWGSRLGAALLISLVADVFNVASVKYAPKAKRTVIGADGNRTTEEVPLESKAAEAVSTMPKEILKQTLNRPATVTLQQGTLINIYTARDIDFASVLSR